MVFRDDFTTALDYSKWEVTKSSDSGFSGSDGGFFFIDGRAWLFSIGKVFPSLKSIAGKIPKSKRLRVGTNITYDRYGGYGAGIYFVGTNNELLGQVWESSDPARTNWDPGTGIICLQLSSGEKCFYPTDAYKTYTFTRDGSNYSIMDNYPSGGSVYATTNTSYDSPGSTNPYIIIGNPNVVATASNWVKFGIDWIQVDCYSSAEECNGWDDDCDKTVDNGLIVPSTTCTAGIGECARTGTKNKTCLGAQGWSTSYGNCSVSAGPTSTETCDGKDNDCDGSTDETFTCIQNSTGCTSSCAWKTQNGTCSGSIPANAISNSGSSGTQFVQTANSSGTFLPTTKTYTYNTTVGECNWKCASSDYLYSSSTNTCIANAREATCSSSKPSNSDWNDFGQNGKYTQTSVNGSYTPSGLVSHYSEVAQDCAWNCKQGYYQSGGSCLLATRTTDCQITAVGGNLPENAKWNDNGQSGDYLQTYTNGAWPTTLIASYNETPGDCKYSCKALFRDCTPNQGTYCGTGTQNCDQGNWGTCQQGNSVVCTINQYCQNSLCKFCATDTKNCDMNLTNGCETNTNTNSDNCGTCGTKCASGKRCSNGLCTKSALQIDTNKCAGITCGTNSTCSTATGICQCKTGYYDCDGSSLNGCEGAGTCNQTPDTNDDANVSTPECEVDGECGIDEQCANNICQAISAGNPCSIQSDCMDDEKCIAEQCEKLDCGSSYSLENHSCVCKGTVCGGNCFEENGACCTNIWNKGLVSCTFSVENIVPLVESANDIEASSLLDDAQSSIKKGNISRARAQAALAELKALITKTNDSEALLEKYDAAILALNDGNYSNAEELARAAIGDAKDTLAGLNAIQIIMIVLAIVALVPLGFLGYKKFFGKKKVEE
ncbi:MAG: MopE-related protein [archaeon]